MLDYRIRTFLTLYEVMNYRRAAEQLNMTQPSVTQHIHALETEYGCRLFSYDGRKLSRTREAELLARYSRAMLYNEEELRAAMHAAPPSPLRIGATKTIGEFVISEQVCACLARREQPLRLTVDNTARLLGMLDQGQLDFAMVEGVFDKQRYASRLMREEPFVGLCPKGHAFAGRALRLEELLCEALILREEGSGTRAILEHLLAEHGRSTADFRSVSVISSFSLICRAVASGAGVSFAYRAVAESCPELATFTLEGSAILHEFNFVYLNGTDMNARIDAFLHPDGAASG